MGAERSDFGDERLILVNERDEAVGTETKERCHQGSGLLHRAFSVYLFDVAQRLLIQQRSAAKPLWPLFWSNSCCSHPRSGERSRDAAHRRVREELGFETALRRVFSFRYFAHYAPVGSESEVCSVYVGRVENVGPLDPNEVADVRFVESDRLDADLAAAHYTPWFRIGWQTLRRHHWHAVEAL